MSKQDTEQGRGLTIGSITSSAIKAWHESLTSVSYETWLEFQKSIGRYWNASVPLSLTTEGVE